MYSNSNAQRLTATEKEYQKAHSYVLIIAYTSMLLRNQVQASLFLGG
jgi:hypothetical protein